MAKAWWRDSDYELFARLTKERDEARAEVERWRTSYDAASAHAVDVRAMLDQVRKELYDARLEAERLTRDNATLDAMLDGRMPDTWREDIETLTHQLADQTNETTRVRLEAKRAAEEAYRRGAEAMREACARWMSEREGISQWVYDDALSALPIPEEP